MGLTHTRGYMDNIVFGTLSGHLILKVLGQISGTMPLEKAV